MKRLVILGCSGSGKTTLAVAVGRRLGLPVVHLDVLFWRPGWQEPDMFEFRERVEEMLAGDAWVSDGNYRSTFDLRLPRADLVVMLERSRWLCLWRVLWRALVQRHRRPDLPAGCPERPDWDLLKYIWTFRRIALASLEAARVAFGPDVPVIRLRSNREVRAFLVSFPAAPV